MAMRKDLAIAELNRVEGQRTLFVMLPVSRSVENLKAGMMERAGWLLANKRDAEANAILEFLPSADAREVLEDLRDGEIASERLEEVLNHPERLISFADLKREIAESGE